MYSLLRARQLPVSRRLFSTAAPTASEIEAKIVQQLPTTLLRGKSGYDAKILWALGGHFGQRDKVFKEVELFADLLQKLPELKHLLTNPTLSGEQAYQTLKSKVLPELPQLSDAFGKFLEILGYESRLRALDKILKNYKKLHRAESSDDAVVVTIAQEWPKDQLDVLVSLVRDIELKGAQRPITVVLDPELKYGFTIKVGDKTFTDVSGRTELETKRQYIHNVVSQVQSEIKKI